MSVDVPRAPRLRDVPEYAQRLSAVQQVMRRRPGRVDGKLVAAGVLALLGAGLLALALCIALAPASGIARMCVQLFAGGA